MKNKTSKRLKAKLFDIKHFPMDLGRIVCATMPLCFHLKKIYVSDIAKKKIKGGAIIASNHTCFLDPLILGCCFWYRRMFYLAAEVVMKKKFLRCLLKGIGCIEINRNIYDMDAIRKTVSILKEGHILSVFPQGGIDRNNNVQEIKSGITLMAIQSNVPVVPVYVYRKTKFFERNCVVIGEPISLPTENALPQMSDIQKFSDTVLEKMTECKNIFESTRR